MKEFCMIVTAFDNKEEAKKVINELLEKRLASCCQMFSVNSTYHWNENIENSDELLVQIKTKKVLFEEVKQTILNYHSYELPEITMFDIIGGSNEYLNWIDKETK